MLLLRHAYDRQVKFAAQFLHAAESLKSIAARRRHYAEFT